MRPLRIAAALYALVAIALWPVPLLNVLHAESSAVLAFAAFFVSGISSLALLRQGVGSGKVLSAQLLCLLVPLLLMTISMLWAENCAYSTGLLFFALFPGVSVVLGTAFASFLDALNARRSAVTLIAVGAAVALLAPAFDLGFFPQLYTYNHVFGGVLGPIYDEELTIRTGLFAFRGLTLLWATLAFLAASIIRRRAGLGSTLTATAVAGSLLIVACYAYSDRLGWNTTHRILQQTLEARAVTDHFNVFYDDSSFVPGEVDRLLLEMEYRYDTIAAALTEQVEEPILVYLYPTASLKGELTGSRYTSVTPVWLRRPQIHMLARRLDESFDHELVHVFAREFGMPIIRASIAVGLVEGLAAALEAPKGEPTPRDLMAATVATDRRDSSAIVADFVGSLDALGFWTGRGAVSYAANGSFVDYLLRTFGAERFKEVYRTADFEVAYGRSASELAGAWYHALRDTSGVSAAALPTATHLFAIPSLFETRCPHYVPAYARAYRDARDRFAVHDTASAVALLRRSLARRPDYLPAAVSLASALLRHGELDAAERALPMDSASIAYPLISVLAGDVAAATGHSSRAAERYSAALDSLPAYAVESRASVLLRRHVAGQEEISRWMLGIPRTSFDRTVVYEDPIGPVIALVGYMRRREYILGCEAGQRPANYLAGGFSRDDAALLQRQALFWLGASCERAGLLDPAGSAYESAASAFLQAGDGDMARYARDRHKRVRWKQSKGSVRRTR